MDKQEMVRKLGELTGRLWRGLGPRRAWIASGCGILVALMALGVWSCQTSPGAGRGRQPAVPSVPALTGEPDVRVRIRQGVQSVKLEGAGQFMVRPCGWIGVDRKLPAPLTASVLEDGIRITDGRGAHWSYAGAVEITLAEVEGEPNPPRPLVRVDGVPYAGRIRIVPREAVPTRSASLEGGASSTARPARLDVIEVVPMETYIAGVTVSELYRHWGLGAYQVQSVAARTYAMQQRDRAHGLGRDYDLESTVLDQAYNGWTDHAIANQAAAETRGTVLKWQGRFLRAYYSSTCGGRFAGAAEIWPTGPGFEFNLDGPIQAHEREHVCQSSPAYAWEVVRDRTELSTRLREWGKANGSTLRRIGLVQSIKVLESNSTGRPVRYEILDDQGRRYSVGAEHLRNACNYNVEGLPEIRGSTPLRVRSGDVEVVVQGSKVTIRGRGFGHGVGMCQFCAQGMAVRGDGWRTMLSSFYPGARVERVY
jgi:stage II sporulation protein D